MENPFLSPFCMPPLGAVVGVASMLGVFASASSPSYIDYLSVWQKMRLYPALSLCLRRWVWVVFLTGSFLEFMRVGLSTGVVAVRP